MDNDYKTDRRDALAKSLARSIGAAPPRILEAILRGRIAPVQSSPTAPSATEQCAHSLLPQTSKRPAKPARSRKSLKALACIVLIFLAYAAGRESHRPPEAPASWQAKVENMMPTQPKPAGSAARQQEPVGKKVATKATNPPAAPLPGTHRIVDSTPGCIWEVWDRAQDLGSQGDSEAAKSLFLAGVVTGACTLFKAGDLVFLDESGFISSKVRRPGEQRGYWIGRTDVQPR